MNQRAYNIYHFFPVQLFILHFRKYQVLLLFWLFLFSIINSSLMQNFGADSLLLSPEYLGRVNFLSCFITGVALGIFVMSWNITTFILHSKRFHFLATSEKPFLRYCINNALIPVIFMIIYLDKLFLFNDYREMMPDGSIFLMMLGLGCGFMLLAVFSFLYFFSAEKKIVRGLAPVVSNSEAFRKEFMAHPRANGDYGMKVSYYLSTRMHLRKVRPVEHYSRQFVEIVFKKHHFSAIVSIGLAFLFIVTIGFLLDNPVFELPAAASIFLFSAIMMAVIGAFTYFLKSWSILFIVLGFFVVNFLMKKNIIDPTNKAYGLDYSGEVKRPEYDNRTLLALATPEQIRKDKDSMITVLEKWKKRQDSERPYIFFINVSGGGLRSAAFVMNTLQNMDSLSGGRLMRRTFLISGASGGMLSATYFREIYKRHLDDSSVALYSRAYTENISKDLLNPVFSSMIARDIFAPVQKFSIGNNKYLKDRGYAFEKKLSRNTDGFLDFRLDDMRPYESEAMVPLMYYNPVIQSDGRRLVISSLPASFMMKPALYSGDRNYLPDAVDFKPLFQNAGSGDLKILTALRMSATFPYVLPNVWLPSNPVIDVMDAGLRDNYGLETTLRFIDQFRDWISTNTAGVVIIQLKDRPENTWHEDMVSGSITDRIFGPAMTLQYNWYRFQDYFQADDYSFFESAYDSSIQKISLAYYPSVADKIARLNFHLTVRERNDIVESLNNPKNTGRVAQIISLLRH